MSIDDGQSGGVLKKRKKVVSFLCDAAREVRGDDAR